MQIRERPEANFHQMRHFDRSVCCRENTEGFLDSHFDGDDFEQNFVATELIILLLLGSALPLLPERLPKRIRFCHFKTVRK